MAEERVQRRLAAILAADVVGYSRLMGADEPGTLQRLLALRRELFEPTTRQWGGRIFKITGDGALAEFASAVDAVSCAVDVQRALAARNADMPEQRRIELRIGVSLGDVMVAGGDLYGNGVNVAARMEGLAEPGGICISGNVHENVKSSLDLAFDDLGEQEVKNIERPVYTYKVRLDAAADVVGAHTPRETARTERPGIAVLPFANMSGDPEQDYFADGMAEEVITGLARIRWLMVIARNSTFAYKGMAPDVRKVGRELGVRYVLEGSVRKAGERVRITAQLIEAQTGGHLWADRYDGTLADVFDLQDQITANVVAAIEPSVRQAEIERVKRKRPESLDAYDLYLRALPQAGSYTLDGCLSAIDLLDQALEREPDFAEAHGLAAKCHFHCFFDHGRAESGERSLEHAKAVLALPTADAATLAYAAEALAQRREYRDTALDLIDRALALNPSSLPAHSYGAVINLFESRWTRAVKLGEEALRLNPFDPQRATAFAAIGPSKLMLGDLRGAEAAERATLQLRPNHVQSRLWLITILVGLERMDEARKAAVDFLADHPQFRIGMFIERQPLGDEANNVMASALRRAGLPG